MSIKASKSNMIEPLSKDNYRGYVKKNDYWIKKYPYTYDGEPMALAGIIYRDGKRYTAEIKDWNFLSDEILEMEYFDTLDEAIDWIDADWDRTMALPSKNRNEESSLVSALALRIKRWYDIVNEDYHVNGKYLGCRIIDEDLIIEVEENGVQYECLIVYYEDYTPEQLFNIWMETDWIKKKVVRKKSVLKSVKPKVKPKTKKKSIKKKPVKKKSVLKSIKRKVVKKKPVRKSGVKKKR